MEAATKKMLCRSLLAGLICLGLTQSKASALPIGADGSFYYTGGGNSTLHIAVDASNAVLQHYTIGLYNLDAMTASADDPDFQIQALQADHVILLQQYGQGGTTSYDANLSQSAHFGLFLLRDASLQDFSFGENAYRPIFSTVGASGSHLLDFTSDGNGNGLFSFQSFLGSAGVSGAVGVAGAGSLSGPNDLNVFISEFTPPSIDDISPNPVVPEPATVAMIGLGLSLAGAVRRRRKKA